MFPPTDSDEIEVYSTSFPKKPYIEIAEILINSKNVYKLKREAAKLGADAVLIVGSKTIIGSTFGSVVGLFSSAFGSASSSTTESGRKAIAIKYTGQRLGKH
jgi:hypothetical protein